MALGQWSLQLRPDTPRAVLDALGYFGHVAITTGRVQAPLLGDGLLKSARYVGVLTGVTRTDTTAPVALSGPGMAFWLGDADDKGSVYETPINLVAASFAGAVTALLPSSGAVTAGVIGSVPGTLTQSYVWTSPRTAITSVCRLMGGTGTAAAEWRVNGDGTLDAGTVSSLYVTTPVAALVRRVTGPDQGLRGLHGSLQNAGDVNDYTTRAVVLAAGDAGSTAVGSANLGSVPYKDIHGNTVKLVRMASQSATGPVNASAAASAVLALYNSPRNALILSSDEFDVRGIVTAGDYVYVQDPDAGLVDYTQEVRLRGEVLNPVLMRCVELDWPVTAGYGAAYRDGNGAWTDLADYLLPESGPTSVVVGAVGRPLTASGEPVGSRPIPDPTVPATPVFGAFSTSSYVGPSDGKNKAQIQAAWGTPLNADGSTVTDGDHYEVQYRPHLSAFQTNPSHAQLASAGYTLASLAAAGGTLKQLIPIAATQWKVTFVAWGTNTVLIQELTPGINYDFQIRAVDTASPPNASAWSATSTVQAAVDTTGPPTPDAPTVAANTLSVQVSWDCGRADGGTFNQDADLHHIEVHGSYEPLFSPSSSTKLGLVPATAGNITGLIPAVGSFTIPPGQPPAQQMYIKIVAVDITGNKSNPSAAAGASAALLSDAYITDLSASKITAGTITAGVILSGTIETAASGGRVLMDGATDTFYAYDNNGLLIGSFGIDGLKLYTDPGNASLIINHAPDSTQSPVIQLTANSSSPPVSPSQIYANYAQGAGLTREALIIKSAAEADGSFARIALESGIAGGGQLAEGDLLISNGTTERTIVHWDNSGALVSNLSATTNWLTGSVLAGMGAAGQVMPFLAVAQYSVTFTAGSGSFSHGWSFTPLFVLVFAASGDTGQQYRVDTITSTTITLSGWNASGTTLSGSHTVNAVFFGN